MKFYVRRDYGRTIGEVEAVDSDAAIDLARKRFVIPGISDPRRIQVFNNDLPAPDPHLADEGRAWWMARGL